MNVFMTRHSIFDSEGSVYAYELRYRVDKDGKPSGNSETAGTDTFLGIDVKSITGNAKVFINFSNEFIKQEVPKMFAPDTVVVEVTANQLADGDVLKALRDLKEQGYLISFDGFENSGAYKEQLDLCDIVSVNLKAPGTPFEEIAKLCQSSKKRLLAKNVNTKADAEQARNLGCAYTQGYFFVRSNATMSKNIQPLPVNLIEIMHLMAQPEPELNDIVDVMSRDTALCQKILKLINSVYFGVSNTVSSINQAVLALGLDYLREWVYLMGMQNIAQNDNVEAMRLALLIAKFCRGLSGLIPEAAGNGDAFYLMGLLSMIVLSSDRDLTRALDEFPLTNDIKTGLLRRGGVYSDVFGMALCYVDGNWDEYEYIARKYGLDNEKVSGMFIKCAQEIGKLNLV